MIFHLLLLFGPPPVTLADADCWRCAGYSIENATAATTFAKAHHEYLEHRCCALGGCCKDCGFRKDPWCAGSWCCTHPAVREAWARYIAWDALWGSLDPRYKNCNYLDVLRNVIGEEAYYSQRMPAPVPEYR